MSMNYKAIRGANCWFTIDDARVTQYPYRTAEPERYVLSVPRDKQLEKELAHMANKLENNHTLYVVEWEDGKSVSILFSDSEMSIGLGVIEKVPSIIWR